MASNSRARYSYRERSEWLANKQKQEAAEAERKKMENTEANFPTLSTAHPVAHHTGPEGYADLAKNWATSDEDATKKATAARNLVVEDDTHTLYLHRFPTRNRVRSFAEEDEEEIVAPAPDSDLNTAADRGWTVVQNRKPRKVKRELTIDEMDARERRRCEGGGEDGEYQFNDELYESNRHDHDRV